MLRVTAKFFFIFCFFFSPLSAITESDILRKGRAHLIIGHPEGAIAETENGLLLFPESYDLCVLRMRAYGAKGEEKNLLLAYEDLERKFPEAAKKPEILKEFSWSVVSAGNKTSALNIRLISLVAAAITQDAKAIPFLLEGLKDTCAPIREISVALASHYGDEIFKEEILSLFHKERNPDVRLKLAEAFANLHLNDKAPLLLERLSDPTCGAEEKVALILAIANLEERIDNSTLEKLVHSPFSTLRLLAAEAIAQLQLEDKADFLFKLLEDPNPEVRTSAIKGIGILKISTYQGKSIIGKLKHATEQADYIAKITAGWTLLLLDAPEATFFLEPFLTDGREGVRALAASAIATAGPHGIGLAKEWIERSNDPFVKANLALGLIRQREEVSKASVVINDLFCLSRDKWMWKEQVHGLFKALQKSDRRHNAVIANFPEVASQAVHLELLNLLAICEDPNALETIKNYMMQKQWEITGIAAEMLLGEGDESAITLIRQLLDDPHPRVRLDAAFALAMWGKDSAALPVLVELYPDSDKITKIKILESLGRIADPKMLSFLVEQLKTSSQSLRIVAAACIIMILNS